MLTVQYVTDASGNPLYVQVPVGEFEKLLADAEELADIAAYGAAKIQPGKSIPFAEAFAEVEAYHNQHGS